MASPDPRLIRALRVTAERLSGGASYRWTHMGACNCGHLAQTITEMTPAEIHALALEKAGDWREQVIDHCPTSGYTIDHVIDTMLQIGMTRRDIQALERLEDPAILAALPGGRRPLDHRRRQDVVLYMRTWADLLDAGPLDADRATGPGMGAVTPETQPA